LRLRAFDKLSHEVSVAEAVYFTSPDPSDQIHATLLHCPSAHEISEYWYRWKRLSEVIQRIKRKE